MFRTKYYQYIVTEILFISQQYQILQNKLIMEYLFVQSEMIRTIGKISNHPEFLNYLYHNQEEKKDKHRGLIKVHNTS